MSAQTSTDDEPPTKILDRLSRGNIVLFECGHEVERLVEVDAVNTLVGDSAGIQKDAFKFSEIGGDATLVIFREDFNDLVTKRITGADSEVADVLDKSERDIRKRPTGLLIDWLGREGRDDLFLLEYNNRRAPVMWMWDEKRNERYADHDIQSITVWESREDCPHTER